LLFQRAFCLSFFSAPSLADTPHCRGEGEQGKGRIKTKYQTKDVEVELTEMGLRKDVETCGNINDTRGRGSKRKLSVARGRKRSQCHSEVGNEDSNDVILDLCDIPA
jgi:hypothetical protein